VEESQADQPPKDLLHESLDTDGDGEVQLAEAAVLLDRLGEQDIGEVTPETLDAEDAGAAAATEKKEAAVAISNEERFAAADADGSGGLSREELAALTSSLLITCHTARVQVFCQLGALVRCCFQPVAGGGNWARCGTEASSPQCNSGGYGPGYGGGPGGGFGGGFGGGWR